MADGAGGDIRHTSPDRCAGTLAGPKLRDVSGKCADPPAARTGRRVSAPRTVAATRRAVLAGGLAAAAACAPAPGLRSPLRVAHGFAGDHFARTMAIHPFMAQVAELSDGSLPLREYPASQLGKPASMIDVVQRGLADIALVGVAYAAWRMPLTTAVELPGLFDDVVAAHAAFDALAREELLEREYLPNGVRPLFVTLMPQYQLLLKGREEIADIADLRGLKFRTPGDTGVRICRALGAIGVQIDQADLYIALERGTVDGALQTSANSAAYSLDEVADALTLNARLGTVAFVLFVNARTWDELDPASRNVLEEAGRRASFEMIRAIAGVIARDNRRLAEGGVRLITLSDAVLRQFSERLSVVEDQWRAQVGARHGDAGLILERFKARIAAADVAG